MPATQRRINWPGIFTSTTVTLPRQTGPDGKFSSIWRQVMTQKTRKRYSAEFKAAAVARLEGPGETLSSVSRALGVAATQVKTWRLEQQAAGSAEAVARRKAEAADLQQLRRDNKRLQEENEILRKASAFFARWAEKA
jgi:transposase